MIESYRYRTGWWDKFRRTTAEPTTRVPYPSTLVPGTASGDVKGGVALADDPATGLLTMYARGADSNLYRKTSVITSGLVTGWTDWSSLGTGPTFNSDPAAVSWPDGKKVLLARTTDGNIRYAVLSTTSPSYTSIGAPSAGIGSSPAVTSRGQGKLDVFVRGNDNRLYWKSLSGGNWTSWSHIGGTGTFRGKPSALQLDAATVEVFLHGTDDKLYSIKYSNGSWAGSFSLASTGTETLAWKSSCPACTCQGADCFSPAANTRGANVVDVIIRGKGDAGRIATRTGTSWSTFSPIGGVYASSPATVTRLRTSQRIDIVTTMDEERTFGVFVPTVWWKQYPQSRRVDYGVFLGKNWSGTGNPADPAVDWDVNTYKGTCPAGWGQLGLSDSTAAGGPANAILCRQVDPVTFPGTATTTLALPGEQRAAMRNVGGTTDWASGYWKMECGLNAYVSGSSMSITNQFHGIRCAESASILNDTGCVARVFDTDNSDAAPDDTDWDGGFYKGECAPNEYMAGISADTATRRPHSILCCPR